MAALVLGLLFCRACLSSCRWCSPTKGGPVEFEPTLPPLDPNEKAFPIVALGGCWVRDCWEDFTSEMGEDTPVVAWARW